MKISSEYTFPIFISSTDYNLKDLRAELALFLKQLGYEPRLSSAPGFHDDPTCFPWESCIDVLRNSYAMILIIDGRYGNSFSWPTFEELKGKKVSPTHGEFLYARHHEIRMFIFIRRSLMPLYQTYHQAKKQYNNDITKTKKALFLPRGIDFDTMTFIEDVKTKGLIPWIMEFDDITDLKSQIQMKLLNELALSFRDKAVIAKAYEKAFVTLLESQSPEIRKKSIELVNNLSVTQDTRCNIHVECKQGSVKIIDNLQSTEMKESKVSNSVTNLESLEQNGCKSQWNSVNEYISGPTGPNYLLYGNQGPLSASGGLGITGPNGFVSYESLLGRWTDSDQEIAKN